MNVIEEFINTKKKGNTKRFYELALNKYFNCIKADPNDYFKQNRDYEEDVKKFVKTLDKYAPITQKSYISVIKRFFYLNDIEFKSKFWELYVKDQIEKGSRALTLDDKPSLSQLKTILSYADLKTKTLVTVLSSSGLRIDECLKITPEDIDFNSKPTVITISSTSVKGIRRPRRVFISNEATNFLKEWLYGNNGNLSGRERYLKRIDKNMKHIYKVDFQDKRVFPFNDSCARKSWYRAIIKAGLNKKCKETDRYELHIHSLRKHFMSQLKTVIPDVIVEALAGHNKYLDEAYRRYSLDEMKDFYLKGMSLLSVFETTPDLSGVNEEINQLKKDKEQMQETINEMRAQISELRLERLEKANGIKKK